MTHGAYESKLRPVVRSSMHPCPRKWLTIGHGVKFYAWAARAFSAGIKWRHCVSWLANNTYTHPELHSMKLQMSYG